MDLTKIFNIFPTFSPTNDGTNRQKEDIKKGITDLGDLAWILNPTEKPSKSTLDRYKEKFLKNSRIPLIFQLKTQTDSSKKVHSLALATARSYPQGQYVEN